ncbi:hypothetical protein P3T76_005439 [Phytophthora citrophthora]|uniref:Uncharacterized protein n=1 Tax=Phytophthora citrophthora TaxID=4793 RepID=A0AAD9LPL0_9STRA|nr:hypothetical protein P3T76_005439 [Phytophthora citrophthora]
MFIVVLIGSMLVILGPSTIHMMLAKRDLFKKFSNAASVQVLMAVLYPAYQVLFKTATGTYYELPVFLLLPLIKLLLKNLVALCLKDFVDLIPENIIFTVHFFNAVYLATCMQSASSTFAIATVLIIDIVETGVTILGIYRSSTRIMNQLHEILGSSNTSDIPDTLLDAAYKLCYYHEKFTKEERSQVQVHSCVPYQLSAEARTILENLDKSTLTVGPTLRRASNTQSMPTIKRITSSVTDLPALRLLFSHHWGAKIQPIAPVQSINVKLVHTARNRNLLAVAAVPSVLHIVTLRSTLATLFTIECMIMAEYIEFFIPLLYGQYVIMMVHLPSVQYHTEMAGVTEENLGSTVQTIVIYGLLELVSFVLLVLLLKKSCGVKALYHLAFVLENHTISVQSKIMSWMLLTLGFRIIHFGKSILMELIVHC